MKFGKEESIQKCYKSLLNLALQVQARIVFFTDNGPSINRQTNKEFSLRELPTPVRLCELVLQPHDLCALLRGDLPQRGVGLLHRGQVLAVLLLRAADQGPLLGKGHVLPAMDGGSVSRFFP